MLISSVLSAMLLISAVALQETVSSSPIWSVHREVVRPGGCVVLVLNVRSREAYGLTLRINDREPQKLVDTLGPTIRTNREILVLLATDLLNPEGFKVADRDPDSIHIEPIFSRSQSEVRLTLMSGDTELGTKTITVLDATEDVQRSLQLLYPTLVRNKGVSRRSDATWMMLFTDATFGVNPPITSDQLEQLREELPIIMRHPDWAEIAEMLVARLEALAHSRELILPEGGGQRARLDPAIRDLPPWPEIVTRCLRSHPQSPYARAIQDRMGGIVKNIRIMDAERRGEDIIEVIKSPAID